MTLRPQRAAVGKAGESALWPTRMPIAPSHASIRVSTRPRCGHRAPRAPSGMWPTRTDCHFLAVRAGYDLDGGGALHATRDLHSILHGFVTREAGEALSWRSTAMRATSPPGPYVRSWSGRLPLTARRGAGRAAVRDPMTERFLPLKARTIMRWNLTSPGLLLRCEGAATLAVATALYGAHGGAWPLFLVLLLVPDLSALGYLVNSVTGAAWYNAAHTYLVPVALGAVGLAGGHAAVLPGGSHLGRPHRARPCPWLRPEAPRWLHGDTPGRGDRLRAATVGGEAGGASDSRVAALTPSRDS